jgi:hypothetical protein
VLRIRAAFKTEQREARVFWRSFGDAEIAGKNTLTFPITGDGELREYTVRLSDSPNWRGAITQLRIDPVPQTSPGASVRVQSVALGK